MSNTANISGSHNLGTQIGQNLGPVTINQYKPSSEDVKPSHNLPFERDSDFVGRENIISQINEKNKTGRHNRSALVGLGGIGKSQIAIEYAYRLRDESPDRWVFWVYANDPVRFKQAYRSIASKVKLPGRDDPNVDILQRVYEWLSEHGPWLLILDNVDDTNALRSEARYLPQSSHGSILVTSRYETAARQVTGPSDRLVRVEPMGKDAAAELLRAKTGIHDADTAELVDLLEKIPLAITHAASYIDSRQISIRDYIQLFQEGSDTHLLSDTDIGDLRRDPEVHHSVILTWEISFQQISRTRPQAADLLSLMSMFERTTIPRILLISDLKKLEFEDMVKTLLDFSMIRQNFDNFDMHRLVQLAIRHWVETRKELLKWKNQAIERVLAQSAKCYRDWGLGELIFPHARAVTAYQAERLDYIVAQARISFEMGVYVSARGDYKLAEQLIDASLDLSRRFLGEDHPTTLRYKAQITGVYLHQGRWTEAEQLGIQVMEKMKRILGEEDLDTLSATHNLATIYLRQGRWRDAEELGKLVLEKRKRVLDEKDPGTLSSISLLAETYINQGLWKEAEQLQEQVIEVLKQTKGGEDLDTLVSMNNLVVSYLRQERWEEAEKLGVHITATQKRVLGETHPNTLTSMHTLASTYARQGRWIEAEKFHVHVMETQKQVLGEAHPSTLLSMSNLASTYQSLGRPEEAEQLGLQVLKERERTIGKFHRDTMMSLSNLGAIYESQGRRTEAEQVLTRVMDMRKDVFGEEDPDTLQSMANLAAFYWKEKRWEDAEQLETQVLETRKRLFGEDHPETLSTTADLACIYKEMGQEEEALGMLRGVVLMRTASLGPDHPSTKEAVSVLEDWTN